MAITVYAKYKRRTLLADPTGGGWVPGTGLYRALLLVYPASFDGTDEFVSDAIAGSLEFSGGGYARQQLVTSLTQVGDFIQWMMQTITFTNLTGGVQVNSMIVYKHVGSNDAANPLVCWYDGGTSPNELPKLTTGGNLTINWNANGGLRL